MGHRRIFSYERHQIDWENAYSQGIVSLVTFLHERLTSEWEIYIRPYLNGDKPDIVLFHPTVGMMFFEVKAWNLDNIFVQKEGGQDSPNGQPSKQQRYYFHNAAGQWELPHPVKQVERYRENLLGLYLPHIGEAIDDDPKKLSAFKVALYFPHATTQEARKRIDIAEKRCLVFGYDSLLPANLPGLVPDAQRTHSFAMQAEWAEAIRFWLRPPRHHIFEGTPIALTAEQKRHVKSSPGKHQRLRGPAGSGKSLIIAHRAANLAALGKKVLIVTFNMTLWHYIKEHLANTRSDFSWENIEFTHFHGFCRNYLLENGVCWPRQDGHSVEEFFDTRVVQAVNQAAEEGRNAKERSYDAILIDEGQDFQLAYYTTLCRFLTQNDELLLVVDERQNVYDRKLDWLESMRGTKFRGAWRELKYSHRLPPVIQEQANAFAQRFLPQVQTLPSPPEQQMELRLFTPHLLWRDVNSFEQAKEKIHLAIDWLVEKKRIAPSEIIVLVPQHSEGLELVSLVEEQGKLRVNHVFSPAPGMTRRIRNKKAFWTGDKRLKMSTIHAFKGWELRNVIILTFPPEFHMPEWKMDSLLYTAITRTQENLIVFNRHPKYREYGQGWPNAWN